MTEPTKYQAQKSYRQRQKEAAQQQREGRGEALELFGRMVAALELKTLLASQDIEFQRGVVQGQKLFLIQIFAVSEEELQAITQQAADEVKLLHPSGTP